MDKQSMAAPIKSTVDKYQLIPGFLKACAMHSYNKTGIKKIVRVNNEIQSTVDREVYLKFEDVKIGEPSVLLDGVTQRIKPHMCRLSDMTYAAPIKAKIKYIMERDGKKLVCEKEDVVIGKMPVMLRSRCCALYGKDETELAKLGECPLDPGGYFIVKGTEKVIMIQEQLSNNRIIIDRDKKRNLVASVTSLSTLRSKTVIVMDKEKIYLQLNSFQQKVPIMVVMKAMGMQSDQEVVQMIGRDPRYSSLLLPSIEECTSYGVYTQKQALEFLKQKVKKPPFASDALPEKEYRALKILREVFIAHVPVRHNNFRAKCVYVAVMLRRLRLF